ncbi:MAG TPA: sigma-70 family RNA polymerase sigma factor [Bacillota bacterium]|nr:sigma-70 family RNA polymerase sigma factor [Bacillota bacterium]HOB87139.1 sigma-70 family RNA polymerase sigma factor [Bacillota bacterium]HOP68550.1 sigma-70 family RNA polymerase sigma factor [Bacillota bacterium]HPT33221.1 sigma-70 family RNA polymerase sigma factor [Bacillota bacterium]HPZ64290.1 sigma-70 family RNA polymerase sigma factor [Bacillota bacterium]
MDRDRLQSLLEQNDRQAQKELFEHYYRRTYAVVYRMVGSRELAEDFTQEAFIKAFQNRSQLRDPGKFGAWLAVIATNLARNHLKREKKLYFSDDPAALNTGSAAAGTEEQVMRKLELEQVRRAIRRLPPEQYQVVVLQYYYDLKLEDIAALLKVNLGTVKSRLFRARQKLARELGTIDGAEESI